MLVWKKWYWLLDTTNSVGAGKDTYSGLSGNVAVITFKLGLCL